jgi:23S rRNA pseudouridine1911/1915/1917 synthase
MNKEFIFQIEENDKIERIDLFLSRKLSLSRNHVQSLIKSGNVLVNSTVPKSSCNIRLNDEIKVFIPVAKDTGLIPQDISLNIIFEDEHVIVINKPPGLVVHPAKGHDDNTLVNAILFHCPDIEGINDELRPGIVHRLDKDTSGVMVVAKTDCAHNSLAEQFKKRTMYKEYLALVKGIPRPSKGTINAPIGRHNVNRKKMAVNLNGRESVTNYQVDKEYPPYSLLRIKPETGRTHQIRVHLSYIGYPVIGDTLYGNQKGVLGLERQALHAYRLGFTHPVKGSWMDFEAPLADDILEAIEKAKK